MRQGHLSCVHLCRSQAPDLDRHTTLRLKFEEVRSFRSEQRVMVFDTQRRKMMASLSLLLGVLAALCPAGRHAPFCFECRTISAV